MTIQNTAGNRLVTLEEFAKFPERPRYELVCGALVELPMAETAAHEHTCALVGRQLGEHVFSNRLGTVLGSNYGYVTIKPAPSTCRNADISYISAEREERKDLYGMFFDGAPDLAVEILSGFDCDLELPQKTIEYLNAGGRTVWVIDIDARTLTVHTADAPPLILTEADTIDGADYLPGFACPVADLLPASAA